MRIAIFSESYIPIINGVSISIVTLRREMERRGHRVFVFAPAYPGFKDDIDGVFRFPSRVIRAAPDYPLPIPFAPRLWKEFKAIGADIVHTQTPFLLGILGLKWARRVGVPVVSTNHTLYREYVHYARGVPPRITRAALTWHMRRYYSCCDAVIAPSRPAADILRSYGIKTRIEVISTGIDPVIQRRSRREVRDRYSIPEDAPLLLYVGRVAREKNLGLLLKAFRAARCRFPDLHLLVVGGGPTLDELKAEASRLANGAVTFTGMLPRDEVWDICRASDIFVFPSVTETQGLAICEALATGLPCVVVNAGGAPEAVEDGVTGCLVPNDPEAFCSAVCELLQDEHKRKTMSEQAIEAARRMSSEYMAERFEQFYESCMNRG